MSRSHVDLCKAEHLIRPIAPLGQTQPLEPTVVQQMWREYVANTSLFERSLIQDDPGIYWIVRYKWNCHEILLWEPPPSCCKCVASMQQPHSFHYSCQCSKKLFVIVRRFAYPNPAISQPSGQVFVQAPWPIAQGVKIWQALANKPLSHSKLSRQSKKDLSVASRLCEEKPWIYTLLTRKDFIDVLTLQSCWFYLMFKVVLRQKVWSWRNFQMTLIFIFLLPLAWLGPCHSESATRHALPTCRPPPAMLLRWNPMNRCIAYNYLQFLHDCSPFVGC